MIQGLPAHSIAAIQTSVFHPRPSVFIGGQFSLACTPSRAATVKERKTKTNRVFFASFSTLSETFFRSF
jgi:hypothetical protein